MTRARAFAVGAAFVAITASLLVISKQPAQTVESRRTVDIGSVSVKVDVADSESAREKGLSGRDGLAPYEGMLFVFDSNGTYAFWMKDMRFSIDIVWLAADGRVVFIAPHVSPSTYPDTFASTVPARYVLELPAGFSEAHGVKIGEKVGL